MTKDRHQNTPEKRVVSQQVDGCLTRLYESPEAPEMVTVTMAQFATHLKECADALEQAGKSLAKAKAMAARVGDPIAFLLTIRGGALAQMRSEIEQAAAEYARICKEAEVE